MRLNKLLLSLLAFFSILPTTTDVASAQVTADQSLGTAINGSGAYIITGGTTVSTSNNSVQSLFHSFDDFSLSAGESAVFDLTTTPSVGTIFSRVTGGRLSSIDGTLAIRGAQADLFLLNPAGIAFGPNAQLNLPGSFFATTGNQLTFKNGAEFNISNLQTPALLTVSAPTGLQMGNSIGRIEVESGGHTLAKLNAAGNPTLVAPNVQLGPTRGLQVLPGESLTLIGNGLFLDGGVLTAPSGNLELGSLAAGAQADIGAGGVMDYSGVSAFQDISLQQRSLANVSGFAVQTGPSPVRLFATEQGRLQVAGRNISLRDASSLLGQNGFAATQPGGPIVVRASGQLLVSDSDAASFMRSNITSETIGAGPSGNVQIFAQDLAVENGAAIISLTLSDAASGAIDIQVENEMFAAGVNPQNSLLFSTITSASAADGDSGDVTVSAHRFVMANSANTTITIFGTGSGGDLSVTADEVLLLGDIVPETATPATISSSTFSTGKAGTVTVNARLLRLENFSTISATSSSDGFAGNIVVNATERVDIVNEIPPGGIGISTAITSAVTIPGILETSFGFPGGVIPKGDSGNVTITTPRLEMRGDSRISVRNGGTGNAGTANIQAENISLKDGGIILARTSSGTGGSVNIDVDRSLLLREGSSINTESRSTGDGGNITISAPVIVALENSDIFADAARGNGGNVNITTQALLGTEFRERRTVESDITASSEFGLSGSVKINNFSLSPSEGLVTLPEQLDSTDNRVAQGCAGSDNNEFIASGRGGLPMNPNSSVFHGSPWADLRNVERSHPATDTIETSTTAPNSFPEAPVVAVVESTGWQVSHAGQVELVTSNSARPRGLDEITCLTGAASQSM